MPDAQRLRSLADFTTDVEAFIDDVRTVPLEPGAPSVRMPGESGGERARRRRAAGMPLQSFTRQRLSKLADGLGVPMPIPGTPLAREVRLER
jgi:LDH2 family malate/lactate/ureidoglycolate dehydrogenase